MIKHVDMLRNGYWRLKGLLLACMGQHGRPSGSVHAQGLGVVLEAHQAHVCVVAQHGNARQLEQAMRVAWHTPAERMPAVVQALGAFSHARTLRSIHLALPLAELWQEHVRLPAGVSMRMAEQHLCQRISSIAEGLAIKPCWDFAVVGADTGEATHKSVLIELVMAHHQAVEEIVRHISALHPGSLVVELPGPPLRRLTSCLRGALLCQLQGQFVLVNDSGNYRVLAAEGEWRDTSVNAAAQFQCESHQAHSSQAALLEGMATLGIALPVSSGSASQAVSDHQAMACLSATAQCPPAQVWYADDASAKLLRPLQAAAAVRAQCLTLDALGISDCRLPEDSVFAPCPLALGLALNSLQAYFAVATRGRHVH